ncbi:hypothetical protein Taro_039365 [Colocasia esculenta]|uniref:Uncharacterized protein n=1 Tax=Colocasia esculenta TaxID=4460 RepID=A0A843WVJ7_COLES|nr:hypothetical protein [Colocasia esculenta]
MHSSAWEFPLPHTSRNVQPSQQICLRTRTITIRSNPGQQPSIRITMPLCHLTRPHQPPWPASQQTSVALEKKD